MARREKGQEEATGSIDYHPGEMIERLRAGKILVSSEPSSLDAVLYVEYILKNLRIKDDRKRITINQGQYYIGYKGRAPYRFVFVNDGASGEELFLAGREDGDRQWEILTHKPGKWITMLEYAYDKVRTCMGELDKFITEFPPIGIV